MDHQRDGADLSAIQQMLASYGAAAAATDPYWSSVVLLAINDNKADTTTSFADQSSYARTLTAHGNVQYSTASAPTGMTSSALCDGAGDYVSAGASTDLDLPGDFTIDIWINFASIAATQTLIGKWGTSGNYAWIVQWLNTNVIRFYTGISGALGTGYTFAFTPSPGTWYQIRVIRSGSSVSVAVNGTQVGTTITNSNNLTSPGSTAIGINLDGNVQSYNGYFACVRVTKGVARSLTETPTLPLPTS